ncbi:MAG: ABC transporter permease subunit [bacterium JZ-2024 1]
MDLLLGFIASLLRMVAAYALAFGFSVAYGARAAQSRRDERWMIPLLDLLQSIPILGFFPAAIFVLMRVTGGGRFSAELAAVFLIFTSMAWNMAFSVFQGIRGIPRPMLEMATAFGITEPFRFVHLTYPACIRGLIFNSMMSWAGGWYFLVASEIIAVGPVKVELPGLGSYLMRAMERGDYGSALTALALLSGFILGMDIVVWRPLRAWSRRFTMDEYGTDESDAGSELVHYYRQASWFQFLRKLLSRIGLFFIRENMKWNQRLSPIVTQMVRLKLGWFLLLTIFVWSAVTLVFSAKPLTWIPPDWNRLPVYASLSLLRILVAYGFALAWTGAFSLWASHSELRTSIASVISQVGASIPATALFPFIIFLFAPLRWGMEFAAVILVMTGMQWYLLFNLLAGIRAVPKELKEMSAAFALPGRAYVTTILAPSAFPYLITGSITGWGGAWNALILSEYVVLEGEKYLVPGIGSYLSRSAFDLGSLSGLFAGLIFLSGMVLLIERLVWKPLERQAHERYRVEH